MKTILYWNIAGRADLSRLIGELVAEHNVDIVALGEATGDGNEMAAQISSIAGCTARYIATTPEVGSRVISLLPIGAVHPVSVIENGRCVLHRIVYGNSEILLATVHLLDAVNYTTEERNFFATLIADRIRKYEDDQNHKRTIVLGDFNLEPFDLGMTSITGFNAMTAKSDMAGGFRTWQKSLFPYFFNPMWGILGDVNGRVPGSYYRGPSGDRTRSSWAMIDQALVRPALVTTTHPRVEVLVRSGLLGKNGKPNKSFASDHLPILLKLGDVKSG